MAGFQVSTEDPRGVSCEWRNEGDRPTPDSVGGQLSVKGSDGRRRRNQAPDDPVQVVFPKRLEE